MIAFFLTILISFFVTSLFGHVVHWALHQSWTGRVNMSHMTHHLKLYPPEDYLSEIYRNAGKDSTPKFFAIAALPLILAPIVLWLCGILPGVLAVTVLVVEGVMGFLHDYLHDAFHIKNHLLTRIPGVKVIFDRWVKIHYLHHVDMGKNYGIFTFHWDRLFGTFWKNS
jgi:hypothetical protein